MAYYDPVSRHKFESAVTVKLLRTAGEFEIFSAILERDPQFLQWNRMSLIGTRDDERRLLRCGRDAPISWEFSENPAWMTDPDGSSSMQVRGSGQIARQGGSSGLWITKDTTQKFAEIEILRYIETSTWKDAPLAATYWFLQRPVGWFPHRSAGMRSDRLSHQGDWRTVPSVNLKFRLITTGHERDDRRVSDEVELLAIPGIEIKPTGDIQPEAFQAAAEQLWFSLRILISFRYRLHLRQLTESISRPGLLQCTWDTVEVQPRTRPAADHEPPLYVSCEDFFAQATGTLDRYHNHRELLHAAVWGYTESFDSSSLEGRLTNAIEGLERLVCAFEDTQGLSREIIGRKEWRTVGASLRKAVDALGIAGELMTKLKQSLAFPAILRLQERVERMAGHYQEGWRPGDREILNGLGTMIKLRNDIVHGRMVPDINRLAIEGLRARYLFERLFLSFAGCEQMGGSGHARHVITTYENTTAQPLPPERK